MKRLSTTILKAARILWAFRMGSAMGIKDLHELTGLLPSDIHRILYTLRECGYVEREPDSRRYRLGLQLLKLGHLVHSRIEMNAIARPVLRRLSNAARATVNLAVLDAHELDVIFIEQVDSPEEPNTPLRVGKRAAIFATAVGKVLCAWQSAALVRMLFEKNILDRKAGFTFTDLSQFQAELDHVRRLTYAIEKEELGAGACGLAAPIFDHTGTAVAALSIRMSSARMEQWDERDLARVVKSSALKVSEALGFDASSLIRRRQPPQPKLTADGLLS